MATCGDFLMARDNICHRRGAHLPHTRRLRRSWGSACGPTCWSNACAFGRTG